MSIFLIYNCAKFHTKILNDCQDIAILLRGAIFFTHPVYIYDIYGQNPLV